MLQGQTFTFCNLQTQEHIRTTKCNANKGVKAKTILTDF